MPTEVDRARLESEAAKFAEPRVTYGDTTFTVRRMTPWRGFHVLEELRSGIGTVANRINIDASFEQILASIILALPPDTVRVATDRLFEYADFVNPQRGVPVPVRGNEEEAFADLEPVHVYFVLARAFAVNFTRSWSAMLSLFGEEATPDTGLSTPGTSPPSSPSR